MSSIERTLIEILVALALVGGFALYEQHKGAAQCVAADTAAVQRQETQEAVKAALDAQVINEEARNYHDTIAAHVPLDVPHVILCKYAAPAAVPQAATPRPLPDAAPASRSPDTPPPRDLGPPLVKVGIDADQQTRMLQDYVTRVCLVGH